MNFNAAKYNPYIHDDILIKCCGEFWEDIKEECKTGEIQIWNVEGHGILFTRLEQHVHLQKELVIVAGEGKNLFAVLEHFKKWCKLENANIRLHSSRPGMLKMMEKCDFAISEIVYRWRS